MVNESHAVANFNSAVWKLATIIPAFRESAFLDRVIRLDFVALFQASKNECVYGLSCWPQV